MPFRVFKKTYFLLTLVCMFSATIKAQSDTAATNASDRKGASSLVFRFTKQVYLNPTIILMRQRFEATTHIKLMLLPRLGNDTTNLTRTDKVFDALLKMLVYNQNTTGSIKFYFAPQNAGKPFSFECSDEVWCKFNPAQKDSVEKILNAPLANASNLNNFSALPFDSVVTRAAKYCQLVLLRQPGKCGDNPNDNYALKQINTTPAKITFASPTYIANNGNGGVDNKQYNQLAAYYNVVADVADNSQYNIAWKAVQSQTTERIKIKLKIKQPGFDFSKVVFKNAADPSQVYTTSNINASDSTITLNLSGQSLELP
jgi:hypothetical protein